MPSYLKDPFGAICVHMLSVYSVVELLELEQILVCRAERAHPAVFTDIVEKLHRGPLSHFLMAARQFSSPLYVQNLMLISLVKQRS